MADVAPGSLQFRVVLRAPSPLIPAAQGITAIGSSFFDCSGLKHSQFDRKSTPLPTLYARIAEDSGLSGSALVRPRIILPTVEITYMAACVSGAQSLHK